ncbi:hypothetical protein GCM10020331_030880 [Ectobacillus funiculus]
MFAYALPYVVVGLTIPLYQAVDTVTFNRMMLAIGEGKIAEAAYSIFHDVDAQAHYDSCFTCNCFLA